MFVVRGMLGIISEGHHADVGPVTPLRVETKSSDGDGIVRFKDHGPINRETLHGVTAWLRYTVLTISSPPLITFVITSAFVKIGYWTRILEHQSIAISLRLGYP